MIVFKKSPPEFFVAFLIKDHVDSAIDLPLALPLKFIGLFEARTATTLQLGMPSHISMMNVRVGFRVNVVTAVSWGFSDFLWCRIPMCVHP